MLGNYITVDGVSSRTVGLFCKQLPVWPIAMQGFNAITVAGRLDNLYQPSRHYNDIQIDIEAVFIGLFIDDVVKYFAEGKKLVLSNMPDRYGIIRQLVAIDQKRAGNGALELKITLKLAPFKYYITEPDSYSSSPALFTTFGNIYSEPLIVMKGCSDGASITVNGTTLTTSGLTGDIYVDVPNHVVYQLVDGVKTVVQEHTTGNLWNLLLVPDESAFNQIEFSGCTISVETNMRWL